MSNFVERLYRIIKMLKKNNTRKVICKQSFGKYPLTDITHVTSLNNILKI